MMTQKVATSAKVLSSKIIEALQDKKAQAIRRLDMSSVKGAIADYFVICTGTSDRHVQSIADNVEDQVKKDLKERPFSIEGMKQGEWVLIDYVDVVVHIFIQEKREFYNIEDLWGDAVIEKFKDLS